MGGRHRGGRSRHALGRSQTVSRVGRPANGGLVDTNVCAHARGRGARRRDRTGIDRTDAGALRASCARARAGDRSRRRDTAAERLRGLTRSLGAVRRCLRPRRRASARASRTTCGPACARYAWGALRCSQRRSWIRSSTSIRVRCTSCATLDRATLWAAQTPQFALAADLRAAHERALHDGLDATDDAALLERIGVEVIVVPSTSENFKVTLPADVARAEAILQTRYPQFVEG